MIPTFRPFYKFSSHRSYYQRELGEEGSTVHPVDQDAHGNTVHCLYVRM